MPYDIAERKIAGTVEEVLHSGRIVFHWTIADFFRLEYQTGKIGSPAFKHLEARWDLNIIWDNECISICLWKKPKRKSVRFTLGVRKAGGLYEEILRNKQFPEGSATTGKISFIERYDLDRRKSQLAPSDTMTIVCILRDDDGSPLQEVKRFASNGTQTDDLTDWCTEEDDVLTPKAHIERKGGIILRQHFKDLLLEGKDHDVTLKVKCQEFKAHENILRARSPVFAAMFSHNMKEADSREVTIDDCDPGAFGKFLEYVYVGRVEDLTPNDALGLYYAGDKYDFSDLKETCVEFLKASLSTNVISDVIVLAMKHGEEELLDLAMAFFSSHTVEVLMTVEWQRFLTCNPIQANELTIKAMKSSNEKNPTKCSRNSVKIHPLLI